MNRFHRLMFGVVVGFIGIVCVYGETSKINSAISEGTIALNDYVLNKIVVSGTGFDLALKDEAKNIFIIDKEILHNKGYKDVQQALQYSPLVTFSDNGFGLNVDLRGQGRDANRAVKLLVNRVPINFLDTSHGIPPYNMINVEDVKSIEVIPGGGAVVYGNGTRGGVINIVTKAPKNDYFRFVLKASSAEAAGTQTGTVNISKGHRLNEHLFLRLDLAGGYDGHTRNGKTFDKDNSKNVYGAFEAYYQIDESKKLDFNFSYSRSWEDRPITDLSLIVPGTQKMVMRRLVPGTGTLKTSAQKKKERYEADKNTSKDEVDTIQTSLNYTSKFNESISFDALAFYAFNRLSYIRYKYPTGKGFMDMGGNGAGFLNQGGGLNLKIKHSTEKNTFIVGLDNVLENSNRANSVYHIIFPSVVGYESIVSNTATKLSDSVYVYDVFQPISHFEFGIGARVEFSNYWMENDQNFQSLFPRKKPEVLNFRDKNTLVSYAAEITPNFKYSDTGNAYIRAELGFISPSPFQMINADPNSQINADRKVARNSIYINENNHIKPEQYLTGEVGWKDEFLYSFVSASLFYTHTFDEIFVNEIEHGTAYSYGNLGETQRAGIEAMAMQRLLNGDVLRLSEGLTYLYTNILQANISNTALKGKQLPYVPSFKITLLIEGDIYKGNDSFLTLFLNNAFYYQNIDSSARLMNQDGYFLNDLGLSYGIKAFKFNLGIRNIFDSFYETYQKADDYRSAMGRNYYAEFRYEF